jgi:hypothetical protein
MNFWIIIFLKVQSIFVFVILFYIFFQFLKFKLSIFRIVLSLHAYFLIRTFKMLFMFSQYLSRKNFVFEWTFIHNFKDSPETNRNQHFVKHQC